MISIIFSSVLASTFFSLMMLVIIVIGFDIKYLKDRSVWEGFIIPAYSYLWVGWVIICFFFNYLIYYPIYVWN